MPKPSVADHLRAIRTALEPLGVRWYVFGAQAVIAAGAVRQTADIDITTDDVPVTELLKTLAGRDKDLEDIRALIRSASKEIDLKAVRAQLRELGALIDDSTLLALFDAQVRRAGRGRA